MSERIKIKVKANGSIFCYPSDVGPIQEQDGRVTTTIKGKLYEVEGETAEKLIARLDKAK